MIFPPSRRRRSEAARWFARLNQPNVTADQMEAFSAWRRRPGAREAFENVGHIWRYSEALAGDAQIQALTDRAMARSASVGSPAAAQARRSARWRVRLGWATGVATVLAGGAAVALGGASWRTGPSEQRTVVLADGTHVRLDSGSRLETRWLLGPRFVRLAYGEALFDVVHDPRHPFTVKAGLATVVARGTRFDVLRWRTLARVVLIRGVVDVSEAGAPRGVTRLRPGQSVIAGAAPRRLTDLGETLAWTQGRLRFDQTPIAEAVESVSRHSARPLRLTGAAQASDLLVSGSFRAGDTSGFVAAVDALTGWTAQSASDGTLELGPTETSRGRG